MLSVVLCRGSGCPGTEDGGIPYLVPVIYMSDVEVAMQELEGNRPWECPACNFEQWIQGKPPTVH